MPSSIEDIIKQETITTLFQPIVEANTGTLIGYEALSRGPDESPLHAAPALLSAADNAGLGAALRYLTAKLAFERFVERKLSGFCFVNVNPQTFLDGTHTVEKILALLESVQLSPRRIVAELTELVEIEDRQALKEQCNYARQQGFTIAIDDIGSGYSGLSLWSSIHPDIIKLDRHFAFDIDQDTVKRSFVSSMVDLSNQLHCKLIVEGVETPEEYQTMLELGVTQFQGFLFGTPQEIPTVSHGNTKQLKGLRQPVRAPIERAKDISYQAPTLSPFTKLAEVEQAFQNNPDVDTFVIVTPDNLPLALMHRNSLYRIFSQRLGRELNERKPVFRYAERNMVVVDENDYLDAVARQVNEGSNENYVRQRFVITRNSSYAGLGRTRDLLHKMTEFRVKQAIYSNPLTQLPGQVPMSEDLGSAMDDQESDFDLIYFDLDNFKAFNDKYGYRTGDDAIRLLAETAQHHCQRKFGRLYHIGGDDFAMVWRGEAVEELGHTIKAEFEREVLGLYDRQDFEAGGIVALDRDGKSRTFPLMTLSVGIIPRQYTRNNTEYSLSKLAADVKKDAKKSNTVEVWKDSSCSGENA